MGFRTSIIVCDFLSLTKIKNWRLNIPEGEGGGTQLFFGRCVPRGFPKVGSRERVFLEKLGVLGAKIQKICVLRTHILAKNKAENVKFF